MKHAISTRWLANPNRSWSAFLIIYGAHMNISFIVKVKVPLLIKWSYGSRQLCWLLSWKWFVSFYVVFFEFVGLAWSKWVASSRVGNPSFGLGFWFLWCGWWPCWLGDEVWEKDLGITYNLCFPIELMDNLPTSESFLFNKIAIPMKTIDFQSTILFITHWRRIVEIFLGLFNQKFEKWYKSWTHLNIIFQSIKLKKIDKK